MSRNVVISLVAVVLIGVVAFFTNGFGLLTAPAAPEPVVQNYDPTTDTRFADAVRSAVKAEISSLEKEKAITAAKLAKAKADSVAKAKAEKLAKEQAALPAKVRQLEKELAALKAAQPTAEVNIAPALAAQKRTAAAASSNMNGVAPATKAKTFPVKVESDKDFEKFGMTINSWSEWESGETVYLPAGTYGVNAAAGKLWAYDQASIATGKPNFVLSVNGIALTDPGTDNTVGGANVWFRVNPDGTITIM